MFPNLVTAAACPFRCCCWVLVQYLLLALRVQLFFYLVETLPLDRSLYMTMIGGVRSMTAAKALLRRSLAIHYCTGTRTSPAGSMCNTSAVQVVMPARCFVSRAGSQWMPIKTINVS